MLPWQLRLTMIPLKPVETIKTRMNVRVLEKNYIIVTPAHQEYRNRGVTRPYDSGSPDLPESSAYWLPLRNILGSAMS